MKACALALLSDHVLDQLLLLVAVQRKYNKKWEKDFPWLEYDENYQGAFCKVCRKLGSQGHTSQGSGDVWITKPFQNWKKAVQKMKAHASGESHIRHLEAEPTAKKGGSIAHQSRVGQQERTKNRNAIKSFLRCTHFLCKQYIPHTTNFDKLIKLVVSDLDEFVRQAAKNASYSSTGAITDFVEATQLQLYNTRCKMLKRHYINLCTLYFSSKLCPPPSP